VLFYAKKKKQKKKEKEEVEMGEGSCLADYNLNISNIYISSVILFVILTCHIFILFLFFNFQL
jgi:hypothetical protein